MGRRKEGSVFDVSLQEPEAAYQIIAQPVLVFRGGILCPGEASRAQTNDDIAMLAGGIQSSG